MKPNIKIDKWDLNNVSSTQSVINNWMTEYANLHLIGNSEEEKERIKREVATINRDRKLDSILENKEFEEFKEEEHELYKTGSRPNLFYFDYSYATPSTPSTSTNYIPPINKTGKKKRTK